MIWIIYWLYVLSIMTFFITETIAIDKDTIKEKYPFAKPQIVYVSMAIFAVIWPIAIFAVSLSTTFQYLTEKSNKRQ